MSFLDELMKEMGGPVAEQLGKREGLNEAQSKGILEGLAPVILGGLKRKKEEGVDLEDLMSGLGAKEEALDNPGGFFEGGSNLDLGAGGVLGLEKGEQAAEAIAKKTGIGVDLARKVLPMLVPLVLAYLKRKGTQDSGTPDRKGGIGAILDRDGDGKILDDIAGMVLASQAGRQGKGGILAMILAFFSRK
ncbi:DUF937 domain-containing protein [Roseibacillus persicicus]|uniref:DUF937 domain-containing protein n=1 Tax=Roseibacillus persicicus TaxID=454148 RepID=UPI00280CE3F8|nr:DUF937 domain-containing protein [Roseibacillus persicicus]MDQ8191647.1 DUF937 domain-containing protein [Roseibacillus persicicus]